MHAGAAMVSRVDAYGSHRRRQLRGEPSIGDNYRLEIHQLRYFCAVARTGDFTRAAEQECVAQPSLSRQIRKLETELGCRCSSGRAASRG
jgi:hypothetical protein